MKLNMRKLKPNEMKAKIAKTNSGGVILLLWKSPLADINVLDEVLDTTDYEITYPSEGRCRISIWDSEKDSWVSKEGIGEGTTPKGLANDALSRAGTAWGIGRELFVPQELFIYKDKLKSFKEETGENGKTYYVCFDEFHVLDVKYELDTISYLKIGIAQYGKAHHEVEFDFSDSVASKKAVNPVQQKAPASEKRETSQKESVNHEQKNEKIPKNSDKGEYLAEDETILMGNCKGKTYQEVKDTEIFVSFLKWAKKTSTKYDDPSKNEQFARIKALADAKCA